ncbi:MAG: hypothetical protein AB7H77_05840, partial [Bdellovibrionales bacterium]
MLVQTIRFENIGNVRVLKNTARITGRGSAVTDEGAGIFSTPSDNEPPRRLDVTVSDIKNEK